MACPNFHEVVGQAVYPREAHRQGLTEGSALMQFTLTPDGQVRDVKAIRATHPVFARASARVVQTFRCVGQGRTVSVNVPFSYKLQ